MSELEYKKMNLKSLETQYVVILFRVYSLRFQLWNLFFKCFQFAGQVHKLTVFF